MNSVTIYHNPLCSKSRETLALLQTRDITIKIVDYLNTPPDITTLARIIKQLGFNHARQLMRTKEACYQQLGLDNPALSEAALLEAMATYPVLIERPIVISGERAKLGRPPQQVLELFHSEPA